MERNNQKGSLSVILCIVILLLLVGGGAYYFGTQKNNTPSPIQPTSTTTSQTPNSTATPIQKNELKTYNGQNYTFMYPVDWTVTGPQEYLETVQILNPNKTVSVTISKGQYPYGFGGEMNAKDTAITINVNGQNIEETETVLNNKAAFVDFAVGEYHILYGTDYPAIGTKASLTDYIDSKQTIAEILASFKITE